MSHPAPILSFPSVAKATPAKAALPGDIGHNVKDSQRWLPILAGQHPDAARLINRHIHEWMDPPAPGGLPAHQREQSAPPRTARAAELARLRVTRLTRAQRAALEAYALAIGLTRK